MSKEIHFERGRVGRPGFQKFYWAHSHVNLHEMRHEWRRKGDGEKYYEATHRLKESWENGEKNERLKLKITCK